MSQIASTALITTAARTVLDDATVSAMVDTLGGAAAQGTGGIVRATAPTITTLTAAGALSYNNISNTLTAFATGGQASATQLVAGVNRVTVVATAADSVKLPAAAAGLLVMVVNAAAVNAMNLFPTSGDVINNLAVDVALLVPAGRSVWCAAVDATNWCVTTP